MRVFPLVPFFLSFSPFSGYGAAVISPLCDYVPRRHPESSQIFMVFRNRPFGRVEVQVVCGPRRGDHRGSSKMLWLVSLSQKWVYVGPHTDSRLAFRFMWDYSIPCVFGQMPFSFVVCGVIVSVGYVNLYINLPCHCSFYVFVLLPCFPFDQRSRFLLDFTAHCCPDECIPHTHIVFLLD
jgi:hypothetical protein